MSLFAFGLGYCASRVVARGKLGRAAGTAREPQAVARWRAAGVNAFPFADGAASPGLVEALGRCETALVSIPPSRGGGDPTLDALDDAIARTPFRRIVYLSTVGVYGDTGGGWVDETSPTSALTPRARARVDAEARWTALGRASGVEVDVLRLGGIYGPGRSAFDRLREGNARRVVKPGQVFNRIHVDDIASAVETVVAAGMPGATYNVVDGAPSPPEDVIAYAASLAGVAPPPEEPFEGAALSEMARSFYEENRRVRADRLRGIGWAPAFRSYREGLAATWAAAGR